MDQQFRPKSESDLISLDQSTTTTTTTAAAAADAPKETKQEQQNSADFFAPNCPFGAIGTGNGNDNIGVLKEKMAALEAKNRFLEGKVYNMELKAKMHMCQEKNNYAILIANREELAKIIDKFRDEAETANKQLEGVIQANQLKITELTNEMAILKEKQPPSKQTLAKMVGDFKDELHEELQRKMNELKDEFSEILSKQNEEHQKQIIKLEKKNKAATKKAKKAEKTAEMAKNQLEERIQNVQQKMADLAKEMALLKEQHLKETITGNQMGPDLLLDHLTKSKRVKNPKGNCLSPLYRGKSGNRQWRIAKKGFPISGANCRPANFPGTIVYYYEVTQMPSSKKAYYAGLSDGNISAPSWIGISPNPIGFPNGFVVCFCSGKYPFYMSEWPFPNCAIQPPQWKGQGDVVGCGFLLKPNNEQAMFFTLNGILLGKQFPINHFGDFLYPTVIMEKAVSLEVNFGENVAKPFAYDIQKCPGMVIE